MKQIAVAIMCFAPTSAMVQAGGPSDARLKTDIVQVATTAHGLPLYPFRYVGGSQRFKGVMAQDVAAVMPQAVVPFACGFDAVDYARLGIELRAID